MAKGADFRHSINMNMILTSTVTCKNVFNKGWFLHVIALLDSIWKYAYSASGTLKRAPASSSDTWPLQNEFGIFNEYSKNGKELPKWKLLLGNSQADPLLEEQLIKGQFHVAPQTESCYHPLTNICPRGRLVRR